MVLESIRNFNDAVPFRPYVVQMVSGERHRVPHPDFTSISPSGSYVIIIDAKDRPHHLSTRLIEEVAPLPRRTKRRASGRRT